MIRRSFVHLACVLLLFAAAAEAKPKFKALIIDGQNNHKVWPETTQLLKDYLEESKLFSVAIATTPPAEAAMSGFQPPFFEYDVVISNYNGKSWPARTMWAFEKYVKGGGAFVSVHAANNAFPEWVEYNKMTALGGWGDRSEKSGPYLRLRNGEFVHDPSPGKGGSHGDRHEFAVEIRDPDHPITRGLPLKWMHAVDELYDRLRGPAENVRVLATAYSAPETRGTGEHEPMLMTIDYGRGRVFHTTLGHSVEAMKCVGFITTFLRGTEWAVSGEVTQSVPKDFPSADRTSSRR